MLTVLGVLAGIIIARAAACNTPTIPALVGVLVRPEVVIISIIVVWAWGFITILRGILEAPESIEDWERKIARMNGFPGWEEMCRYYDDKRKKALGDTHHETDRSAHADI